MATILTKKKDTTGAPVAGDLTNSAGGAELAVNTFDKRLYSKDSGGNVVEIGTNPTSITTTQIDITATGDLRLQDTTGGQYVALQAPGTVSASYTLTMPAADGTSGQAIVTDGAGNLSFSNAGISTGKSIAMAMIFGF